MARLSFRCDDELVRRVDAARDLIPREAWLRRAVEQALALQPAAAGDPPAPAERPAKRSQERSRNPKVEERESAGPVQGSSGPAGAGPLRGADRTAAFLQATQRPKGGKK